MLFPYLQLIFCVRILIAIFIYLGVAVVSKTALVSAVSTFGNTNARMATYGLGAVASLSVSNAENAQRLGEAGIAIGM